MATQVVVALYESKGYAQDARNRLHTEGVSEDNYAHTQLKEIDLVASTSKAGLAVLSIDALVFGNIRDRFAKFIGNGETAVLVRAESDADATYASDVLRLFTPIAIEVFEFEPAR